METICYFAIRYPEKLFQIILDFKHDRYDEVLNECINVIEGHSHKHNNNYKIVDRKPIIRYLRQKGKEIFLLPDNFVVGVFHTWYLNGKKVTRVGMRNVDETNRSDAIELHIELDKALFEKGIIGHVFGEGKIIRYKIENGKYMEVINV